MTKQSYSFVLAALLLVANSAMAQFHPPIVVDGNTMGASLGSAVACAGDVNADGFDDIIVGAWLDDSGAMFNAGTARVYSGANGALLHSFAGVAAFDLFGYSVSGAGDVNNDGFDDVIVGAIGASINGSFSGSARVHSGVDGSLLFVFVGDSPFDSLGASVSGGHDINNDGFDDLIVGVIGDDDGGFSSGSVRVYSGFDGSQLFHFNGSSLDDQFGVSVSSPGDVNQDGFADIFVGANQETTTASNPGRATLFSGMDGSVIYNFTGQAAGALFGNSVSGAGDIDCDGAPDLIVGSPGANSKKGMAIIYSGQSGTPIYTLNGTSNQDRFGQSVDNAGDTNGDGFADVIIGAQFAGNGAGRVRVFSGADGSSLATMDGDSSDDQLGFAVSGAGDLNGDGFSDIMMGAPNDDNTFSDAGSVRVYLSQEQPVLHFSTESEYKHLLSLKWLPNSDDPQATVGTIHCSGAIPGGLGDFGVSLGKQDTLVFGFLPMIIDLSSPNFLFMGSFGFDSIGEVTANGVSRQSAPLAGQKIYVQFFQTFPLGFSSNAIRMELVP